jgi:hypothetical protein
MKQIHKKQVSHNDYFVSAEIQVLIQRRGANIPVNKAKGLADALRHEHVWGSEGWKLEVGGRRGCK